MHTISGLKRQLAAVTLLSLSLNPIAHAINGPYLQIGDGRLAYVFRWTLPNGTVLKQGMTDDQGRAVLVPSPGKTDYLLETQWGAYKVAVPARCWKARPDDFKTCVKISPREDSAAQKAQAAQDALNAQAEHRRRTALVAWVEKDLPAERQEKLIHDTLAAHQAWMKKPAAELRDGNFSCRAPDLPVPSPTATESFEKGKSLPEGEEQERAYIEAAKLGHWRAAARLASRAMENEDWESAQPIIAWLLKNNIPSGYAKLADLVASTSSYDGATVSPETKQLITTLRWRAAQLGDPVAQSQMSRYFANDGQTRLANDLLACARAHNPEIR